MPEQVCSICEGYHSASSYNKQTGQEVGMHGPPRSLLVVTLGKACSKIRVGALSALLTSYPCWVDVIFLESGFKDRFRIPFEGIRTHRIARSR